MKIDCNILAYYIRHVHFGCQYDNGCLHFYSVIIKMFVLIKICIHVHVNTCMYVYMYMYVCLHVHVNVYYADTCIKNTVVGLMWLHHITEVHADNRLLFIREQ